MMFELKHWLAPPVFPGDNIKTLRAGILHTAILVVMAFTVLIVIGNLLGGKTSVFITAIDAIGFCLACGFAFLLHRGKVQFVGVISLALSWGFITASAAMLGTIRTPTTALYFFLIIAASLLYEMRGLVLSILASSIAVAGLVWAENARMLPSPDYTVTITQWITWTILFGFGGGFVYWGFRTLRSALAHADTEIAERKRAEELLRLVTDNMPAYVAYVDANDLRYRFVNRKYAISFQHPREQIIEQRVVDVIGESNFQFALPYIQQAQSGKACSYENTFTVAEGQRWIQVNFVPDIDETGRVRGIVVLNHDITERKRAETALRESEASLKFSQQVAHVGHWIWDTVENRVTWSDEMYRIFGLDPEKFNGDLAQIIAQAIHPEDKAKVEAANAAVLNEQKSAPLEYRVVWNDQSVHTVWAEPGAKVVDADGKILKLSGIVQDITARKEIEQKLHDANLQLQSQVSELNDLHAQVLEQAIRDPLTHLYNRRYLNETLPREIARALREEYPLAVLMMDIDHFKNVNDTHGHLAGDAVLKALANLITTHLRASDIVCRYGGEEILCLLLDTPEDKARERGQQLCDAIANLSLDAYPGVRVTVSIGVAILPPHGRDMISVLKAADEALYHAKEDGRNCVRVARIPGFK